MCRKNGFAAPEVPVVLCFNDRIGGSILSGAMKKRRFAAAIIYGWLAALIAGCSTNSSVRFPVPLVPDTLKVSANETLSFVAKARGVQIYECRAKTNDAGLYEWVFKAPEAELFDAQWVKGSGGITPDRSGKVPSTAAKS